MRSDRLRPMISRWEVSWEELGRVHARKGVSELRSRLDRWVECSRRIIVILSNRW